MSKSKKSKGIIDSPILPPMEQDLRPEFASEDLAKTDEIIGHSDGIEVDSERPDYCKKCDRRFGSESANRAHQREEHK